MKHLALLLFLLFSPLVIFGQSNLRVGDPAPPITITEWLANTPEDTTLRDKFIVLEFWATWCKPCLEAVPHLNELQAKFPVEDLYFISITDEEPDLASSVFDRVDFHSIVVTDEYGETHRRFGNGTTGLSVYPFTVLIDREGMVRWYGKPEDLTENMLERLLRSEYPLIQEAPSKPVVLETSQMSLKVWSDLHQDPATNWFLFAQQVEEPEDGKGARSVWIAGRGGYTAASPLREIFEWVLPDHQLELPLRYELRLYEFAYLDKQPSKDSPARIVAELCQALGLEAEVTTVEATHYLIKVVDSGLLVPPGPGRFSSVGKDAYGNLAVKKSALPSVAAGLTQYTDDVWTYRGKDKQQYDLTISLDGKESILASLEQYGMEVKAKSIRVPRVTILD
jgi:thiol-disulfide isomerase/thioredoxin